MRCLVIVAHPDDETIWMGGTIIRYSNIKWHVLSLCRGDDPERAPRFIRATNELGAQALMSDLDDTSPQLSSLSSDLHEIKDRVSAYALYDYDVIFTHGPNGEYQHKRHTQVYNAVKEMAEEGRLTGELLLFAYNYCGIGCPPKPASDAHFRIELTTHEYEQKQHIIRDIYGFTKGSFEFDSAGSTEAFSFNIFKPSNNPLEVMEIASAASI